MKKVALAASVLALLALSGTASALELKGGLALTGVEGIVLGGVSIEGLNGDDNSMDKGAFAGASGVVHAAQNNGANSLIQTGTTVAAVLGEDCDDFNIDVAVGATELSGAVVYSGSVELASWTDNTITRGSFEGFTGVAQVSQNNGANSLIQSGTSVAVIVQ